MRTWKITDRLFGYTSDNDLNNNNIDNLRAALKEIAACFRRGLLKMPQLAPALYIA
jgi:hypothetical protein